MDKLREEFEKWVVSISSGCADLSLDIHGIYDSWDVERYWEAWQASRASIVVDVPEACAFNLCDLVSRDDVIEAVRSIGLSIKGE